MHCRDNRYCVALTTGKSEAGDKFVFKLERSDKPHSKIHITSKPDKVPLNLGDQVTVDVIGHEHQISGEVEKVFKGNEMAFAVETLGKDILKLRQGRFAEISIDFKGAGKKISYSISLQGVASVLAMMDVVQGRPDREDAAIVSGGEDASLVSNYDFSAGKAPPAAQSDEKEEVASDPEANIEYPDEGEDDEDIGIGSATLVYEEKDLPERVLMAGYRVFNCDFPSVLKGHGAQVIGLDPGVFLYLVPCKTGDVNVEHYAAVEIAGEVEALEFQEPASATGERISTIINPSWDNNRNVLVTYQHFSPNYDCGRFERHNLSIEEKMTYLAEYRLKENCDGKTTLLEEYPLKWNGEGD